MIERVYTSVFGVSNCSRPSKKNGRFSGYDSATRGSNCSCGTSDSICEKSGLIVPFNVKLSVTPQRTLPPGDKGSTLYFQPVGVGFPLICEVSSGLRSSTNPRVIPVKPSSVPNCPIYDVFARGAGAQVS